MKTTGALLLLAALANAANANADPGASASTATAHALPVGTLRVEVAGARIHAKDIFGSAYTGSDIDLGVSPPIGSSRILERSEIERAFTSASATAPKKIPTSVRVTRKSRRLSSPEVVLAIRTALAEKPLPRSSTLASVHASATEVPADYQRVKVDLPSALPRRAGPTTVQAIVSFLGEGDATLQKSIVAIDIVQPPEAAFAEIQRGMAISLVVRKGLVEVSVPATASMDADVGSILSVTLKPSGRVLRARAVDKDHAVALEDS